MVDKLKKILQLIEKGKGTVSVFAIFKMDELVDKWSLVFSASWLDDKNSFDLFQYIQELLKKELSVEELNSIARIGLFKSNEHIVNIILSSFSISDGSDVYLKDSKLNGYRIHEA